MRRRSGEVATEIGEDGAQRLPAEVVRRVQFDVDRTAGDVGTHRHGTEVLG